MNTVTLSSNYQLIIPEVMRDEIGFKAGTSFEIISYDNRIELIPIKSIKSMKGIFKGINTNIIREIDRIWTSDRHFKDLPAVNYFSKTGF